MTCCSNPSALVHVQQRSRFTNLLTFNIFRSATLEESEPLKLENPQATNLQISFSRSILLWILTLPPFISNI